MNETMNAAIAAQIPQNLDQVITRRRDCCALRLSRDDELVGLARNVRAADRDATDRLTDWRIVCFERTPELGGISHILLGEAQQADAVWATSPIVGLDLIQGWAVTTSGSLYRLRGKRAPGEPPLPHVLHMCRMLHLWGLGQRLGVLTVF